MFEKFLEEKLYLEGCSPRTIKYYRYCYASWERLAGGLPTNEKCNQYVIALRKSGISVFTINSYIRGLRSYFSWLDKHGKGKATINLLKEPKRVVKTIQISEIKRLLGFRPRTFHEHRTKTLICLLVDTGIRIDEALTLKREKVDFDNLLITVVGKGDKERTLPISLECRKELFKFLSRHEFSFVFPTRHGGKVYYRSALDQLKRIADKVGVKGVSFHKFRHTFASSYIRDGGNVFYLQRLLGHSDIQTTKVYVNVQTEDLSLAHRKFSLLSRLSG